MTRYPWPSRTVATTSGPRSSRGSSRSSWASSNASQRRSAIEIPTSPTPTPRRRSAQTRSSRSSTGGAATTTGVACTTRSCAHFARCRSRGAGRSGRDRRGGRRRWQRWWRPRAVRRRRPTRVVRGHRLRRGPGAARGRPARIPGVPRGGRRAGDGGRGPADHRLHRGEHATALLDAFGVREGDVIAAVDGIALTSWASVVEVVATLEHARAWAVRIEHPTGSGWVALAYSITLGDVAAAQAERGPSGGDSSGASCACQAWRGSADSLGAWSLLLGLVAWASRRLGSKRSRDAGALVDP